jgi:hypothetical protein
MVQGLENFSPRSELDGAPRSILMGLPKAQ